MFPHSDLRLDLFRGANSPLCRLRGLPHDRVVPTAVLSRGVTAEVVLSLQLLHHVTQLFERLKGLFGFLNGELGVLFLLALRALVHGQSGTSILHVLEPGVVQREEREDPLSLSITVDVQLQVCQHRGGAGFAARAAAVLALAALPHSPGKGRGVKTLQAALVTAADLAQHLQPLRGLHTVPRLHIQRLL